MDPAWIRTDSVKMNYCNKPVSDRTLPARSGAGAVQISRAIILLMIPESAGATPFGIFMLAKSFDEAAMQVMEAPALRATHGPVRLLLYHACELYLKAYLRSHQWDVSQLRSLNHDLSLMLDEAILAGLNVAPITVDRIREAAAKNDYVRARYVVTEDKQREISPEILFELTANIRESVQPACHRLPGYFEQHWK